MRRDEEEVIVVRWQKGKEAPLGTALPTLGNRGKRENRRCGDRLLHWGGRGNLSQRGKAASGW